MIEILCKCGVKNCSNRFIFSELKDEIMHCGVILHCIKYSTEFVDIVLNVEDTRKLIAHLQFELEQYSQKTNKSINDHPLK